MDEETFLIAVTVRRSPTNEVEDWEADPNDFVSYLKERYELSEDAPYGLDSYNKHAGQHVTKIELAE